MKKELASNMNRRASAWLWVLGLLTMVVFWVAAILAPMPQPVEYHQFADQRMIFGIPNFYNVVSNLVFLVCGAVGLLFLLRSQETINKRTFTHLSERWPYVVLFLSVVLTCFGSAYYHWAPDNERLLWDRFPIAVGIMALLAATLVERASLKVGLRLMPWLVIMGIGSVLHWYWSEQQGAGNLNFYIVVQFYSLFLIIMLAIILPSRYTYGEMIYWVIGLYGVAKLFESLDSNLYALGGVVSGHTLKHLIAALAVYWIYRMLKKRTPIAQ